MTEKITKGISIIFTILWCFLIFVEHWQNNPDYGKAMEYFHYADLLCFFLVFGGALSWVVSKIKNKPIRYLNGLTVFLGLVVLDVVTMVFFSGKIQSITLTASGLFAHLGHLIGVTAAIFSIYLVARIVGGMFAFIFPLKIAKKDLPIIQTALGITILTFLLFFLGTLGLLKIWIVAPLLLLILGVNLSSLIQILQSTLFQPFKLTKSLNTLGIFSFLFLGLFLIFDFVQILRPFPAGTDSINLYVNLPNLIGDYGALIAGHQPYNWSLFMSLGTVVFGRIDVTLGLSFLGGILSLGALFQLSRKWLSVNESALCILLFGSLPMVNFLLFQDMKIDMGLLFITLCILILFYNWIVPPKSSELGNQKKKKHIAKSVKAKKNSPNPKWLLTTKAFFATRIPRILQENRLLVVIGFLAGFAFGIKLTVLFFFFAIGAAIWYVEGGFWALLAAFFLLFGAVFILQLDAQSQLRSFHNSVNYLQWILLAIGIGLTAFLVVKQRKSMLRIATLSVILGAFFLLPILPWFGKNLSETGSFDVHSLLNGKKAVPEMSIIELEKLLQDN